MTTIRNAVFTCNNWSEDHIEKLKALPHVRYCCFGKEFAPTTGTPHLQGYIQFSTKVRLNSLKKKLKGFRVPFLPRFTLKKVITLLSGVSPKYRESAPIWRKSIITSERKAL